MRLYENNPLIKGLVAGRGRRALTQPLCSTSPASVTIFCGCCSMSWFSWQEQSWVSRFRFVSHLPLLPDTRAHHVMSTLLISLTTRCPTHGSPLGHIRWVSVGSRSPLWSPGLFLEKDFLFNPLDLAMGCPKFNPDESAFKAFVLATKLRRQWLCCCNVSHKQKARIPSSPHISALPHGLSSFPCQLFSSSRPAKRKTD